MCSCVVLFSGGIDSTTALYWALRRYDVVRPLTFDYGQRHRVETRLARRLVRRLGLPFTLLRVDLGQVGGSALTDRRIAVPRTKRLGRRPKGTPATYVPFRNGILIALAAAWAEARGLRDLVVGFNVIDSPNYPDTRRAFVRAMERAVNLGTTAVGRREKTRLRAPFIALRKSEIIRRGLALGVDYSLSVSCYAGREVPCGQCSACRLRARAWREAGREDPLFARLKKEGKI
ncbi:MAG: 7-cyano-7-deazaguanine synthase QueC [Candidatus Aminicenantes bacterium]|nr:7-cyano-7-deazaguanine synthase QueC [Candidatus Aminicenantes bacterium]